MKHEDWRMTREAHRLVLSDVCSGTGSHGHGLSDSLCDMSAEKSARKMGEGLMLRYGLEIVK